MFICLILINFIKIIYFYKYYCVIQILSIIETNILENQSFWKEFTTENSMLHLKSKKQPYPHF